MQLNYIFIVICSNKLKLIYYPQNEFCNFFGLIYFERPKSVNFTWPFLSITTLSGFKSLFIYNEPIYYILRMKMANT